MGLNLEKASESLRRRILAQLTAEDREATRPRRDAVPQDRVPPAERLEPAPALAEGPKREEASPSRRRVRGGGVPSRYFVEFTLYSCRPYDWDNRAAAVKAMQDAMVERGWLPGDGWRQLDGTVRVVKVKTKAEQRTEARVWVVEKEL